MATAEEIIKAVAVLVKQEGKEIFSREDIRRQLGVDRPTWERSYTGIFQMMRSDGVSKIKYGTARPRRVDNLNHPLKVGPRFKDVFRRVEHGRHTLTEYGWRLIDEVLAEERSG
uniref:Uncharacterized protein n=1 Tax=Thermogemmatispora argillosa TaxID=2045280 RepID=A0A455T1X9_9CHLR|nr:hypothetical protein KTA_15000 [Thermogemmatispora argillosa]